ncbi:MAG: preprotein translocase subunit SecE [Armatimonadetes bacterium]|nr:preprotein translocase subunit SecE [Armatimonadota bacterium]
MLGLKRTSETHEQRPRQAQGRGVLARLAAPFSRLATFLREVRIEASRVVWPSKEETYTYTVVVIVAVVVVAAWVGLWDLILTNLISALNLYR